MSAEAKHYPLHWTFIFPGFCVPSAKEFCTKEKSAFLVEYQLNIYQLATHSERKADAAVCFFFGFDE